jgi:hypothetical protein
MHLSRNFQSQKILNHGTLVSSCYAVHLHKWKTILSHVEHLIGSDSETVITFRSDQTSISAVSALPIIQHRSLPLCLIWSIALQQSLWIEFDFIELCQKVIHRFLVLAPFRALLRESEIEFVFTTHINSRLSWQYRKNHRLPMWLRPVNGPFPQFSRLISQKWEYFSYNFCTFNATQVQCVAVFVKW